MDSFSLKGNTQIGWMKAPWPFAKLTVSRERLTIATSFFGNYDFAPNQIAAFESWEGMTYGLHIIHTRPECPRYVLFTAMGTRPSVLIARMAEAGFVPSAPPLSADAKFRSPVGIFLKAMAMVWAVLLVIFVLALLF